MKLLALDNSIVVTVLFYSICFLVGLYFHASVKSFNDYAIGGNPFYMFTVGATTVATIIGAEYTFGFSEQLYNVGIVVTIMFFAYNLRNYLTIYVVGSRMVDFRNHYTMGSMWATFFNSKNSQIFCGVMSALIGCFAIAMQIAVFGYMAEAFLGIDGAIGAVFSTIMIALYCYSGGVRAVIATDVLQIVVIIVVFPLICYFAVVNFGGMTKLLSLATASDHLTQISDHPKLYHYLMMFIICVLPHFDPAEFHRLIIARTAYRIRRSMKLAAVVGFIFYVIVAILTIIAFLSDSDVPGNQALLYTLQNFIPGDVAVAGYLAIIAVVMSTTDSYLNSSSVILVNDVIEPLFGRFSKSCKHLRTARLATLIIATVACYLALSAASVMDLVYKFIDIWFPTVVVPMYACMFNIKTSFKVVVKAMAVGLAVFFAWQYFDLESTTSVMPVIPSMLANVAAFALLVYAERRQPLAHLDDYMGKLSYHVQDIDNKCNLIGTNLLDGEIEFNENDIFKLQQLEAQARLVAESLNHTIKRAKRLNEVERLKNIELETKDHLVRAKAEENEEA